MKVITDKFHVKVQAPNGAEFSIPKEVIIGIKSGELDDDRYYQAKDFLLAEQPTLELTIADIKALYEGAV